MNTSSSIIALNQRLLSDPRLPIPDNIRRDTDMLAYFCQTCHNDRVLQVGLMPRAGTNNLPFTNQFVDIINQNMPAYDPTFDLNWKDVTDARAQEALSIVKNTNKNLYVQWSGGIDSTCIVVAILQNFDLTSLDRVTICCTYDSIMEYPGFYEKHVMPNFKIQDLNKTPLDLPKMPDAVLIDGQTADTLTMSMAPSLDVCMAIRDSNLLVESWRKKPDSLIAYLKKVTGSKEFALWYYERIKENVESVNIPIETYFDFMWWAGFNYDWAYQTFCQWFYLQRTAEFSYLQFSEKYMPWYCNEHYQLWSMKNIGAWVKHGNTLASFKRDAKKYCYDYTKDQWNYLYKTKVSSKGRPYKADNSLPFAITNDFCVLGLDQDLDEIIQLLPTHLKS